MSIRKLITSAADARSLYYIARYLGSTTWLTEMSPDDFYSFRDTYRASLDASFDDLEARELKPTEHGYWRFTPVYSTASYNDAVYRTEGYPSRDIAEQVRVSHYRFLCEAICPKTDRPLYMSPMNRKTSRCISVGPVYADSLKSLSEYLNLPSSAVCRKMGRMIDKQFTSSETVNVINARAIWIDGYPWSPNRDKVTEQMGYSWRYIRERLLSRHHPDCFVEYEDGFRAGDKPLPKPKFTASEIKKAREIIGSYLTRTCTYSGQTHPSIAAMARAEDLPYGKAFKLSMTCVVKRSSLVSKLPYGTKWVTPSGVYATIEDACMADECTVTIMRRRVGDPDWPEYKIMLPNGEVFTSRSSALLRCQEIYR